ncbi:hypothetical protein AGMMS50225_03030 [Betaproteobacteria bacterium]|nr:hypothetical protein AGMMS50225_03030 [Betaproteobacteria bacterium]
MAMNSSSGPSSKDTLNNNNTGKSQASGSGSAPSPHPDVNKVRNEVAKKVSDTVEKK